MSCNKWRFLERGQQQIGNSRNVAPQIRNSQNVLPQIKNSWNVLLHLLQQTSGIHDLWRHISGIPDLWCHISGIHGPFKKVFRKYCFLTCFPLLWVIFHRLTLLWSVDIDILQKDWFKTPIPAWNKSSNIFIPPYAVATACYVPWQKLKEHGREIF